MSQTTKHSSLRESTRAEIGDFLFEEGFVKNSILKNGILNIINLISDYHEEGVPLFPEVIIVNDLSFFKTLSNREVIINKSRLSEAEFEKIIKLCAPLAVGSWIIFIEIKNKKLTYGIVDAEMRETSPSIYEQTVGSLSIPTETNIAYIRNIGNKIVELTGLNRKLIIFLTLTNISNISNNTILDISKQIARNCKEEYKSSIITFLNKTIDEAIKKGHGNLIGIIEDDVKAVKELKKNISDGIYLNDPIDIADYISYTETEKTNESSVSLKAFSSVLISMLNYDGIALLSNKGRLLGYRILIPEFKITGKRFTGGARTKAYQSMINSDLFDACFFRSQDGNTKIWIKE